MLPCTARTVNVYAPSGVRSRYVAGDAHGLNVAVVALGACRAHSKVTLVSVSENSNVADVWLLIAGGVAVIVGTGGGGGGGGGGGSAAAPAASAAQATSATGRATIRFFTAS